MAYGRWPKYVSVAARRAKADKAMKKLAKKGTVTEPVEIEGRKIARTFWGMAWCDHLEKFSDFENRLPRGRTYVRNGSVCHLAISKGKVEAIVSGSSLYKIEIKIAPLPPKTWAAVKQRCAGQIGSMLELLQGNFSDQVMGIVTDQEQGLFPAPKEINLGCDCPDWAEMCKHVAAVLYGVGARLDQQPELLFLLRNVDHEELISTEMNLQPVASSNKASRRTLATNDLADVFGVDMAEPIKPSRRKMVVDKKVTVKESPLKKSEKKNVVKKGVAIKDKPFNPTADVVRRLRKRFEMNVSEFAALVGVSSPTISNWEAGSGKLNLRQNSKDALFKVIDLTDKQAARRLKHRS